jgi:amino acid transporter
MSKGSQSEGRALKPNALGIWHVGAMAMAWMGLAIATYFIIPFMEQAAGPITPLIFLLLIVAVLPTAISYAVMNNRRPSAGSAYTWLWESTHPWLGLWLGWLVFSLYGIIGVVLQPLIGGQTFNSILSLIGIHTGYGTAVIGGFVTVAIVMALSLSGVKRSTRNVLIFLAIEVVFVLLFSLYLIIHQGIHGHLSTDPLNPSKGIGGLSGLKVAVLFGVFSIAGFDIVATVAEESESPKSMIPKATIWVTILAGLFWAFTGYALAVAAPVDTMNHYLNAASQNGAVYLLAGHYIHGAKVLVIFTAATAIIAIMGSVMLGGARMLYALAREGYAPRRFGVLDANQTPRNALMAMFTLAAFGPVLMSLWQGHSEASAYSWLGQVFVFFVIVPYIFVNIANIAYHLRFKRDEFNIWLNGVIPSIGIVVDVWIIYEAFFKAFLGQPFKVDGGGSSIVWLSLAWAAVGAVWATFALRRGRKTQSAPLYSFDGDPTMVPAGAGHAADELV